MLLPRHLILVISILSYGCVSTPGSSRSFSAALAEQDTASVKTTYSSKWWRALHDPAIDTLVDHAFTANPTLDQALARVGEAKAQVSRSRSDYFPTVDVSAGVTQEYDGSLETAERSRTSSIGPSLSWEIDLFGRVRNANEAANSRLAARTAEAQNTRLVLASDIATNVLDVRACWASKKALARDVTSRNESLNLLHKKRQAGFSTKADLDSARRDLAYSRINLASQNERCEQYIHALVALSGMDKAVINVFLGRGELNESKMLMPDPPTFPEAIEATALMNHPSILAATRDARAAWADINVAKAQRLPKLEVSALLTGQWIRAAGTTIDFTTWALGATVSSVLFDGGRGAANVDISQARYQETLAVVEDVLRNAVQDAQNALIARESAEERHEAGSIALKAARSSLRSNETLWRNGSASLLELEDARRQLLTTQISFITAKRDRTAAWIALHRVLGAPLHTESKTNEDI